MQSIINFPGGPIWQDSACVRGIISLLIASKKLNLLKLIGAFRAQAMCYFAALNLRYGCSKVAGQRPRVSP